MDGGSGEREGRYSYEVRAVRNFRGTLIEGPASAVVEGIPEKKIPPSPPRGLLAVYQEGGIALRWDENPEPDIAGYDVYRRAEEEETFRKMNPHLIREPHFLDPSADPRKSYTYRLKAVDSSGIPKESDFSQDADVSPPSRKTINNHFLLIHPSSTSIGCFPKSNLIRRSLVWSNKYGVFTPSPMTRNYFYPCSAASRFLSVFICVHLRPITSFVFSPDLV